MNYLQKKLEAKQFDCIELAMTCGEDDSASELKHMNKAYFIAREMVEFVTCKNCRHWGVEAEAADWDEGDGTKDCDQLRYDMIPGIDGDAGWFRCGPDFSCAGFEPWEGEQ